MRHQARLVNIVSPPGDAHTMFDESAMPLLATPPLHRQNQTGATPCCDSLLLLLY